MIKIYSSGKIIHLISSQGLFEPKANAISVSITTAKKLLESYKELIHKSELREIFFYNENETFLMDAFKSMFKIIEAAGGLVQNAKKEYLFIFRKGKWDLPKGKIEKGESIKEGAVREVEEECGIRGLSIIRELPATYHTYFIGNKNILKPTYWFEMKCTDEAKLVPQAEEGITEVRWIASKDLGIVRANTYDSILDVFSEL